VCRVLEAFSLNATLIFMFNNNNNTKTQSASMLMNDTMYNITDTSAGKCMLT